MSIIFYGINDITIDSIIESKINKHYYIHYDEENGIISWDKDEEFDLYTSNEYWNILQYKRRYSVLFW